MMRHLVLALLLSSNSHVVSAMKLNIHMPLHKVNSSWTFDSCPYNAALEANLALRENSDTEELNFFETHTPHITLFLTEFDVPDENETILNEIAAIVDQVVSNHSHTMCNVQWPEQQGSPHVASAYAMYPIPESDCLHQLSNDIVTALQPYVKRPQEIPAWVYNLPLFTQWRKIWYIKKYGSPNVFGDYTPHVTVGYDESADPEDRKQALLLEQVQQSFRLKCQGLLTTVAVGRVGPGGSVFQNGIVGSTLLKEALVDAANQEE
jgi:2'-5' RNA ligase